MALVGSTGSGKSTVARLVTGLYKPWEGEILFDGRPREEIGIEVLASSLAFVDQSIFLFEGTVRDNLTLWDATVPLPEVVAAARDAAIHEDDRRPAPAATTARWTRAAPTSAAASSNAWRSPARWWAVRASWCSTRRPARSTRRPRR